MAEISDEAVEAAALSDAAFDGRNPWDAMPRHDRERYRTRARAALTAALPFLEAKSETKWQSMESAPKDGTVIVVYDPQHGSFVAQWSDLGIGLRPHMGWNLSLRDYGGTFPFLQPTHWTPLPTPPEVQS